MESGKIAIIVVIVIVAIVMVFVAIYGVMYLNAQQHRSYCENWSNNIEQQRTQLDSQLFSDYSQFNQQVLEYNKECAY